MADEETQMGKSRSMDKRLTTQRATETEAQKLARLRRAVVVGVVSQPGAPAGGKHTRINTNDPRQTGDGHWMTQRCATCGLGRTNHPDDDHAFTMKGDDRALAERALYAPDQERDDQGQFSGPGGGTAPSWTGLDWHHKEIHTALLDRGGMTLPQILAKTRTIVSEAKATQAIAELEKAGLLRVEVESRQVGVTYRPGGVEGASRLLKQKKWTAVKA